MTKKNNNKGFTLVELLCTIVIVILLTACITLGIGLCTKTFGRTFSFSKAQTLASTLNYLISDELRTATDVSPKSGSLVKYTSENYGKGAKLGVSSEGCVFVKTEDTEDNYNKEKVDLDKPDENYYTLAAPSLYGKTETVNNLLHVSNFEIKKENGIFKVHYEIVEDQKGNTPLVTSDFQVKAMEG